MRAWKLLLSRAFAHGIFCLVLLASITLSPRRALALPWPVFPNNADSGEVAQQCLDIQASLVQKITRLAFDLEAAAARYEQLYPAVRGDADSEIVLENGGVFPNLGVDTSDPERFTGDPNDPNTSELASLIDELRSLQEEISGLYVLYEISVRTCEEELAKRAPPQVEPPLEGPVS